MSRILLTVLFSHLCTVTTKILIFTFVTQIQFDTRNPNCLPLAVYQLSNRKHKELDPHQNEAVSLIRDT